MTKMVKHEGILKYIEEIKHYEEILKNQARQEEESRFSNLHRGEPILEAVLAASVRTNNKDMNTVKIIQYVKKLGCKIDKVKHNGFGKAEVTFIDIRNANKCLEKSRKAQKE